MYVKLFRRCNKVIDLSYFPFQEVNSEPNDRGNIKTIGFYCRGANGDFLMLYVDKGVPMLRYESSQFKFLDNDLRYSCRMIGVDIWVYECQFKNDGFKFIYKPYVFDAYDDDSESDVNFGLWLDEMRTDKDRLERFIFANSEDFIF